MPLLCPFECAGYQACVARQCGQLTPAQTEAWKT